MLVFNEEQVRSLAPMPEIVECLLKAFRDEFSTPARQIESVPGSSDGRLLLLMPAFDRTGRVVVKLSTYFPDNSSKAVPVIHAVVVVFSDEGAPVAILDGAAVTRLRTGAASALASTFLSRTDSTHLLILGTGALAPQMAEAHCAVRPITRISVWGRRCQAAEATAKAIRLLVPQKVSVSIAKSVEQCLSRANGQMA
jgi:ornithine cyclodeaminase/alanine dehydrogenase-like protein (mu-crystallin family)